MEDPVVGGGDNAAARLRRLKRIIDATVMIPPLLSEYLQSRGLSGEVPPVLRLHPSLSYWDGGQRVGSYPAMVASVVDAEGGIVSVHRTYLMADASGKAPVRQPQEANARHLGGGSSGRCHQAR